MHNPMFKSEAKEVITYAALALALSVLCAGAGAGLAILLEGP